jgi:hypothetical protein
MLKVMKTMSWGKKIGLIVGLTAIVALVAVEKNRAAAVDKSLDPVQGRVYSMNNGSIVSSAGSPSSNGYHALGARLGPVIYRPITAIGPVTREEPPTSVQDWKDY